MRNLILAAALALTVTPVLAAALTGTWNATSGPKGVMIFSGKDRVSLEPIGFPPLKGAYTHTGRLLEIRPSSGISPETMVVTFSGKDRMTLQYASGSTQSFQRKK